MPKLLYLATEDWAFCQHFLPMARAAKNDGFHVVVAARGSAARDRITSEGFRFVPLDNVRGSFGPRTILRSIAQMAAVVRAERPDIVHCISLRVVLLGGIAARMARANKVVLAVTGLGHLWVQDGPIERLARPITRFAVGRWLRRPGTYYLFENPDDPREFNLDLADPRVVIVDGAGVDPIAFAPSPEPVAPPIKVAVIARMLKPKGIAEAVAATQLARARGAPVELHLFGTPDPGNRTSYTEADLRRWSELSGVFWHGQTADPAAVYRDHHIAMLLSHREGLPKTLVEAAAIGRPIVTTDVAGCREVARDGIEGFCVPRGDVEATAMALARLAGDAGLRARMGKAARERFEERFTEERVQAAIAKLYRNLMAPSR
jgi:glycosyltransferase involved in cell wall biosynthesis